MQKLITYLLTFLITLLAFSIKVNALSITEPVGTESRLTSNEKWFLSNTENDNYNEFMIFDGSDVYLKCGKKSGALTRYDIPGFNLEQYPYFAVQISGIQINFWYSDKPLKMWARNTTNYIIDQKYAYSDGSNITTSLNNTKQYYFNGIWNKSDRILLNSLSSLKNAPITNNIIKWSEVIYTNHDIYFVYADNNYNNNSELAGKIALQKNINGITITPTLKVKSSFNSGTNAQDMQKITVEFSSADKKIIGGKINFRLQYGANDFKRENIPVYSHYKLYGRYQNNESSPWEEIDEEEEHIFNENDEPFYFKFKDYNYKYDFVDAPDTGTSVAEASVEFSFNVPKTITVYQDYKIEFYFENTKNFYLYVMDSLNESNWYDTPNYLEDTVFYYFPPQYRYAFISSNKQENTGKIFYPTYQINHSAIKLGIFKFNYATNTVEDRLSNKLLEKEDYYSFTEFNFKYADKECIVLSRKKSEKYYSYYDPDFLKKYSKLFPDKQLIEISEMAYFYVPKGYTVTFATEIDKNVEINTPDGVIKIDTNLTFDNNNYLEFDNNTDILNYFSSITSLNENVGNILKNVWTSLKESPIATYIMIIITSTLIILITSAINRK